MFKKREIDTSRVQIGLVILVVAALGVVGCGGMPEPRPWAECEPEFLAGIPDERIATGEYGARDMVLLDSEQSKDEVFALIVTDNRVPVFALRINYFSANELFKIESVVDGSCLPIRKWGNPDRDTRDLQNWDHAVISANGTEYGVRLGFHGSGRIEANLVPPN